VVRGTVAERIRKALDTPVAVKFERVPLKDVLEFLEEKAPGISFRLLEGRNRDIGSAPVSMRLKQEVPLGAALQAIQDTVPGLRFAVREYGVLVTREDQLPPGAMLVHDFWKGEGDKEKPRADTSGKGGAPNHPPAKQVQGEIKEVNRDGGLVAVDLGNDSGVVKGNTLEVYRLKPRPMYLGAIQVVDVHGNRVVAKPLSAGMAEKLQVGDLVASRLIGR
jgi:hypothetical protein